MVLSTSHETHMTSSPISRVIRWLEISQRLRPFYKPNITTPTIIEKYMRLNRDDMKVRTYLHYNNTISYHTIPYET